MLITCLATTSRVMSRLYPAGLGRIAELSMGQGRVVFSGSKSALRDLSVAIHEWLEPNQRKSSGRCEVALTPT